MGLSATGAMPKPQVGKGIVLNHWAVKVFVIQLPVLAIAWAFVTALREDQAWAAVVLAIVWEVGALPFAAAKETRAQFRREALLSADWVRGAWRGVAPGFQRRFKAQIVGDYGVLNLSGLTGTADLLQVFVEPRLDYASAGQPLEEPAARRRLAGNRPFWDFLRAAQIYPGETVAWAVTGPPGCGKTTLLQSLAVTMAQNRQARHGAYFLTPILLFLRDHAQSLAQENPPTLAHLAQSHFADANRFPALRPPARWFEKELLKGRCLVLLDGLDEVADAGQRRAVAAWVDKQINDYPRCRFVVAARPQGYAEAPLQRAGSLAILPFNHSQIKQFAEQWRFAEESRAAGFKRHAAVRQRAAEAAAAFRQCRHEAPAHSALDANPLLLTLLARAGKLQGAPPDNRFALYSHICGVALQREPQARNSISKLRVDQKLAVLGSLAAYMMEIRERDISLDEVLMVIAAPLAAWGINGAAVAQFPVAIQTGSGLLSERPGGKWGFAHPVFQEYLTANYWVETNAQPDWKDLAEDSWWHETLMLYALRGDVGALVRDCLESDTAAALSLVAECLAEDDKLLQSDSAWQETIRGVMEEALVSDDENRRRIAAEFTLSQRLAHGFYRINDNMAISAGYVSYAEYQIFLDEQRRQGKFHQPAHWSEYNYAPAVGLLAANEPAGGMNFADAAAFCEWLTRRQGGHAVYRLPRPAEVRIYSVESDVAAWSSSETGPALSGFAPEAAQKLRDRLALVRRKPDSSLVRPSATDLAHQRQRDLARERDLPLALGFDLARARACLRARVINHDLRRARDRALVHDLTRSLARDLALDATRARSLARTLDMACDFSLALGNNLANTRKRARERPQANNLLRARDLALAFAQDLKLSNLRQVVAAQRHGDLHQARLLVHEMVNDPVPVVRGTAGLLDEILAMGEVQTWQESRLAARRYLALLFEYAYIGAQMAEQIERRRWAWPRRLWAWLRGGGPAFASAQERVTDWYNLHWYFQVLIARHEDSRFCWEGIRITREILTD